MYEVTLRISADSVGTAGNVPLFNLNCGFPICNAHAPLLFHIQIRGKYFDFSFLMIPLAFFGISILFPLDKKLFDARFLVTSYGLINLIKFV